jgi:Spy/CpxP family protein refolding chaperone
MKKILTLVAVFIVFGTVAQRAELKEKKKEQIKSLKIGFITNQLSLTNEEASKFWPIYNAFEVKQQEIKKQKLNLILDELHKDSLDKISDKEATAILAQIEIAEDELFQLKKKFITSLKGVISPLKILKLKKVEENFTKKLLELYRDKKKGK